MSDHMSIDDWVVFSVVFIIVGGLLLFGVWVIGLLALDLLSAVELQ